MVYYCHKTGIVQCIIVYMQYKTITYDEYKYIYTILAFKMVMRTDTKEPVINNTN